MPLPKLMPPWAWEGPCKVPWNEIPFSAFVDCIAAIDLAALTPAAVADMAFCIEPKGSGRVVLLPNILDIARAASIVAAAIAAALFSLPWVFNKLDNAFPVSSAPLRLESCSISSFSPWSLLYLSLITAFSDSVNSVFSSSILICSAKNSLLNWCSDSPFILSISCFKRKAAASSSAFICLLVASSRASLSE